MGLQDVLQGHPVNVVLVEGTWHGAWAQPETPFRYALSRAGFQVSMPPFEWSGDISGIPSLTASRKHSDWKAGGAALAYYLRNLPYEDRNIIAHSHGGQVVAYCAARHQVPIRRVVTVSTPTRRDMAPVWADAVPLIGYWAHVASKDGDWFARLGQAFDGHFGWERKQSQADVNVLVPGVGHTGILSDPETVPLWRELGLFDYLRLSDVMVGARSVAYV